MRFFRRGFIGLYGSSPRVANAKYTIFGSDIGTSNTVIDQIGVDGREVRPTSCLLGNGTLKITFPTALKDKYVKYQKCSLGDTAYVISGIKTNASTGYWTIPSEKIKNITIHNLSDCSDIYLAFYKCTGVTRTELYDCSDTSYPINATLSSGSAWSVTYNPNIVNWSNIEGFRWDGTYYIPKRVNQNLAADGNALTYTGTAKHNLQITGKCLQNLNETTAKGFYVKQNSNISYNGTSSFIVAFDFIYDGNIDNTYIGFIGSDTNTSNNATLFGRMLYSDTYKKIYISYYDSTNTHKISLTQNTVSLVAGNKYCIIYTFNGISANIFINGVEYLLDSNSPTSFYASSGKFQFCAGSGTVYFLHGKLWNAYIKIGDYTSIGYDSVNKLVESKTPTYFYPCQESYYENATDLKTVYDVVGGNHATITLVSKTMSQITGRQEYDNYNLKYGYTNFSNGTNTQNIPYSLSKTKTITTPTISGYSAIERPYSATKHNLADGRIIGARSSQFVGLGTELATAGNDCDGTNVTWSNIGSGSGSDNISIIRDSTIKHTGLSCVKYVPKGTFTTQGLLNTAIYKENFNINVLTGTYKISCWVASNDFTKIVYVYLWNSQSSGNNKQLTYTKSETINGQEWRKYEYVGLITSVSVSTIEIVIASGTTSSHITWVDDISVREILNSNIYLPSGEYQDMFWCKDACTGNGLGYPEIWKSTLRDTIYYDSANPFRWCPCEMNHAYMLRYINNAYLGTFLLQYSADGYIGETSLFYPALTEAERSSYGFANGLGSNVYGVNIIPTAGADVLVDGDFTDSPAGWDKSNTTISSGVASFDNTDSNARTFGMSLTQKTDTLSYSNNYILEINVSNITGDIDFLRVSYYNGVNAYVDVALVQPVLGLQTFSFTFPSSIVGRKLRIGRGAGDYTAGKLGKMELAYCYAKPMSSDALVANSKYKVFSGTVHYLSTTYTEGQIFDTTSTTAFFGDGIVRQILI